MKCTPKLNDRKYKVDIKLTLYPIPYPFPNNKKKYPKQVVVPQHIPKANIKVLGISFMFH